MQLPRNFLKGAFEQVRARGGLCVADEVRFTRIHQHTRAHTCSQRRRVEVGESVSTLRPGPVWVWSSRKPLLGF